MGKQERCRRVLIKVRNNYVTLHLGGLITLTDVKITLYSILKPIVRKEILNSVSLRDLTLKFSDSKTDLTLGLPFPLYKRSLSNVRMSRSCLTRRAPMTPPVSTDPYLIDGNSLTVEPSFFSGVFTAYFPVHIVRSISYLTFSCPNFRSLDQSLDHLIRSTLFRSRQRPLYLFSRPMSSGTTLSQSFLTVD